MEYTYNIPSNLLWKIMLVTTEVRSLSVDHAQTSFKTAEQTDQSYLIKKLFIVGPSGKFMFTSDACSEQFV